jgi:hypothetical protein
MMISYKYGEFSSEQMHEAKLGMQKRIFFLLLLVDKRTAVNYQGVNVEKTFESLLTEFGGLNELLGYPPELVSVLSLVNAAKLEYESSDFSWTRYRKLILDAGSQVEKIKEE